MDTETKNKTIVFFDGECALCNWGIQFIIKRDKLQKLSYVSMQYPMGKKMLELNQLSNIDSIVLFRNGRFFTKSSAVLLALGELKRGWQFFLFFKIIPKKLRDSIYDLVARNRKKWFGTTNYCTLPNKVLNF